MQCKSAAGRQARNLYTPVRLQSLLQKSKIIFNPGPVEVIDKAKSIGAIHIENLDAIPNMPGIVKKSELTQDRRESKLINGNRKRNENRDQTK